MQNFPRAKYSFVVGFLLVGLSSLQAQATTLVGSTPGEFAVGQSGAASYNIPIQVPPGINGMAPTLSFQYNSQVHNGLLGLGWNLAGLSYITRCPSTIAQGGVIDGVDFDSNDKFCLDGQRLKKLASPNDTGTDSYGSYTEYRTDVDIFSRVRSYGTAGSGPASFRVWTKSGRLMEYGVASSPNDELLNSAASPASRVEAKGLSDVLVWALNKAIDTSGNYMTISYTEDAATGEFRVKQIDYTGNAGQSLSTYASVRFGYESRTDSILRYISGSKNKTTQRLTNVTTYVSSTVVKDYRLSYGSY
ncbi:MAG TPA: SpvB/TcaC N-terminal domain-containing protein, partial [Patescibacteria group bacterium]|nr:SpvB/TcaC N-terminal domain-containing protein [Patescibacteria group bacterium]